MESNQQSPVPSNSNQERASNIQTPEEVLSQQGNGPNNQLVISYHRRYPDGEYGPVMLSPGYPFSPEDDELIVDYLNKEISKEHAPYIRIPKVNVYKHTPLELAESHESLGKDQWYFFSPRDRKYLNGNRPNRAAGNGYWKATGADKKISRNGKFVGSKKCLVFYEGKPPKGNKTIWIMQEYVADQPRRQRLPNGADDMRLDDCVLCRIYRKSENSPKEEKEAAASESGETAKLAASRKPSENKKQAAPKRVKTNQQHNLPVVQPNLCLIYKKSENTPEEEKEAAASEAGESAKPASSRKSSENKKQVAPRRVKTEHKGTYQQHNLPVLQPNLQMQQQNLPVIQPSLPTPQQNQVLQPNLSMPQQNRQAIHHSLQPRSYNLGGQLDFHSKRNPEEAQQIMLQPNVPTPQQNSQAIMQYNFQPWSYNLGGQLDLPMQSNPEEAQPIMLQPNLPRPQQNPQAILQYSPQPWSYNLDGQLDFLPDSNSEVAQPIMLQPNLPTPQQNMRTTQYSFEAGSHDLGGQLDFPMESIPEEANQFHFDDLGNNHETVGDLIHIDTVGDLTYPPVFQNGFNDFYPCSSMVSFDQIPPSLHPQNGT